MNNGLEDVVAAHTILSDVDGSAGRLIIRGYPVETLAADFRAEQGVALLLDGFFDDLPGEEELTRRLGAARADIFHRAARLAPELARLGPYDGVRAGVALLPDGDSLEDALRLIAAPAVLTPMMIRIRDGEAAIPPAPTAGHAADIVYMLGVETVPDEIARALDSYLVTVCDHGLNASTFAARVVASTHAGLTSCVLAGLSALKGPLHGGAPGPVIAMLDAIASGGDARAWLSHQLACGERLMGFGHRIYRTRDPRADALKRALAGMSDAPGIAARLAFAEEVERIALELLRSTRPGRALQTNVEYYTALLLEAVGFPPDAFTCVFAMGRTAGWIAHAREQRATGRLIRPQSRYVGPQVGIAA